MASRLRIDFFKSLLNRCDCDDDNALADDDGVAATGASGRERDSEREKMTKQRDGKTNFILDGRRVCARGVHSLFQNRQFALHLAVHAHPHRAPVPVPRYPHSPHYYLFCTKK